MANDQLKRTIAHLEGGVSVFARLVVGAAAGMLATLLTYPLDTTRVHPTLPKGTKAGWRKKLGQTYTLAGLSGLYSGLSTALLAVAPYSAFNFTGYDVIRSYVYGRLDG